MGGMMGDDPVATMKRRARIVKPPASTLARATKRAGARITCTPMAR